MIVETLGQLHWRLLDTQIVVVGALCAMSCALLGTFLVLRRMSLMGDAISHAVLPGLAAGFLLTGSRDSLTMLLGAGVVGVLTAVFTQWIHSRGQVEHGAAMGVVFSVLFATGLILIRLAADRVDLDPDCVLYGAIETAPLEVTTIGGWEVPRAGVVNGVAFLLNAAVVLLLYKEFKLSAFDPTLATTLGINANFMHYLLMALVAATTVAAFESVGSILVVAMLIVPPATAYLLTDRLHVMLLLSLGLAAGCAGLGHWAALAAPGWFGLEGVSTSTAGMMAVAAGALFFAAVLAAPRHGVVSKLAHRLRLSLRIAREDWLGLLFRLRERGMTTVDAATVRRWQRTLGAGPLVSGLALRLLRRRGLIARAADAFQLTEAGAAAARRIVRSHRLWEAYLDQQLPAAPDHYHASAERLEHVTDAALERRLAETVGHPRLDPQGKSIPPRE